MIWFSQQRSSPVARLRRLAGHSSLLLVPLALGLCVSPVRGSISNFEILQQNHDAKGIRAEVNRDPGYAESGGSLKIEPLTGFDLGTIQYNWRAPAGTFDGEGIKFWAKGIRQRVVMSFIIQLLRPKEDGGAATYGANFVVSNLGSTIVLPFSDFKHVSGATTDFPAEVSRWNTYVFIKYYKTPISTVFIDSMRPMEVGDQPVETALGPPDPPRDDPDLRNAVGEESSAEAPMLYNFASLPSGYAVKGIAVGENGSPPLVGGDKAEAGLAVKLEPSLGFNISDTQFNFRVPAGRFTGSSFKFWAKAEEEGTILDVVLSAGNGAYAAQVALDRTGRTYEIPFKDFQHRSGQPVNIGRAVRENLTYVFFKYFRAPISTVFLDSVANGAFNEEMEAAEPATKPESLTTAETAVVEPSAVHPIDTAGIHDPRWKLKWSEEFDGPKINTGVWNWAPAQNRNSEIGYFTNRPENSFIEDGKLVIQSLRENYKNLADFTSAELTTKGKVNFRYGKLEILAKLPGGKGIWPAFWLLGENGSWPANGEIDVIEMIGGPNDGGTKGENVANGSLHWSDKNGRHRSSGVHYHLPEGNFTETYRRIGILWSPNKIRWYVDDHIYREADISPEDMSEFREDMYVLLNTSIGGGWPGNPDETTVFPVRYFIDYVRYYEFDEAESQ